MTGASGHRRVPKEFYEEMMIPVPPIPVQKEIFAACEKIEAQYRSTRMSIKEYRQKIVSFLEEKEIMVTKIKETD